MATAKSKVSKAKTKVVIAPSVFEPESTKVEEQAVIASVAPIATPTRGLGIGALVKDLISQGLKNDEILVKVKEQFPSAATNSACVAWYRADLKKKQSARSA